MEYELKLNREEVEYVLAVIAKQPLESSLNVFMKIGRQMKEQEKEKAEIKDGRPDDKNS